MGSLCLWVRYDLTTRWRSAFPLWRNSLYCSVVMKMHHQWKRLSPEMSPACKLVLEAAEVLVADSAMREQEWQEDYAHSFFPIWSRRKLL